MRGGGGSVMEKNRNSNRIYNSGLASYGVESVRVAEILYGDEAGKSFCYLQLWRTRLDLRYAVVAVAYNSYGVLLPPTSDYI